MGNWHGTGTAEDPERPGSEHKGPRAKQLHSSPGQNAQALRSVPGGALGFYELNLELPANYDS